MSGFIYSCMFPLCAFVFGVFFLWIAMYNSSRLFFLLRRFPIDSTGRTKKLHEV